jgi:hypothetical protein
MKRIVGILMFLVLITGCEKFSMPSELTLSGKYYVNKLELIVVENPSHPDTSFQNITFLVNDTFVDHSLPHPFDSIVVGDFYMDFDYTYVRFNWIERDYVGRDIWEYGVHKESIVFPEQVPNEIMYRRDPLSYNNYDLGSIFIKYFPKNSLNERTVRLHVDSDLLESIQFSGFEVYPYGQNGPKMRLVISLTRT